MELFFLISFLDCSMSSVYVLCVLFILMTHCKKKKRRKGTFVEVLSCTSNGTGNIHMLSHL